MTQRLEMPLKIVRVRDLKPGMNLQLQPGSAESAEVVRIDGSQVYFTDGRSITLDANKVAVFNENYIPCPEPENDIPTNNKSPRKGWRISNLRWNR